jgi:hypothetical protein
VTEIELRFDAYLPYINSDVLKSMVKLWGGRGSERKDACIEIIIAGLSTPQRVRWAIEKLATWEHAALALLGWMGGIAPANALAIGLRASGVELPNSHGYTTNQANALIAPLIKRGLLLTDSPRNPGEYYDTYGISNVMVFSDRRLLAAAGLLKLAPLKLTPAPEPTASLYRRPPTVVMEMIGVIQAIQKLGGLHLTKAGAVRASDMRKLAKALGWQGETIDVDGLSFPNPAGVLPSVLYQAGLLTQDVDQLVLTDEAEQFARQSYAEQIDGLFQGFIRAQEWREWSANDWYDAHDTRYSQARLALAVVLGALPLDSQAFVAIDDLDQALFNRIGEHFSLSFLSHTPYAYNKTPDQIKREQEDWRVKLRQSWMDRERKWLQAAFSTWLYYLGIVDLGMENQQATCFRLTELGRALLHPELSSSLDTPSQDGAGAWLVQPDFEVLMYLDRASAEQIAFMERHAERVQAQQHMARYRLTRDSIYQGLESGGTQEELLERLRIGAAAELPQNVQATISEWAGQREKITLRRAASLLEFADSAARQAALDSGLAGTPVAERFVLLTDHQAKYEADAHVDYTLPPPASLVVLEDGRIKQVTAAADLLLQPQLDRWAERVDPVTWQLTAASVERAIKVKASIDELFELLRARLTRPLPPLLSVALRAWAGDRPKAELARITVLRCTRPVAFAAIASSPACKPYLLAKLAPDLLLIDGRYVELLKEQLAWAGLDVANILELKQ